MTIEQTKSIYVSDSKSNLGKECAFSQTLSRLFSHASFNISRRVFLDLSSYDYIRARKQ